MLSIGLAQCQQVCLKGRNEANKIPSKSVNSSQIIDTGVSMNPENDDVVAPNLRDVRWSMHQPDFYKTMLEQMPNKKPSSDVEMSSLPTSQDIKTLPSDPDSKLTKPDSTPPKKPDYKLATGPVDDTKLPSYGLEPVRSTLRDHGAPFKPPAFKPGLRKSAIKKNHQQAKTRNGK
jgi:hypothetical protein